MPTWWKGKSKPNSKSSAASEPDSVEEEEGEKDEILPAPERRRGARKEKANSFDGVLVGKKAASAAGGYRDSRNDFAFGHPLPLPSASSPLPSPPAAEFGTAAAAAAGSASYSSVSSSGSSEDTTDLGFYSPVVEHPRSYELPESPATEIRSSGKSNPEAIFNPSGLRGSGSSPVSLSPMHPVSVRVRPESPSGRQEELRSPPHPLPLPPNSPVSPPSSRSSRSSQTQWKKGKLLGRGTFGHVYLGFNR